MIKTEFEAGICFWYRKCVVSKSLHEAIIKAKDKNKTVPGNYFSNVEVKRAQISLSLVFCFFIPLFQVGI